MKKHQIIRRIATVVSIAFCATLFVAVPAFAANVTQVSLTGLSDSGGGVYKGAFGETRFAEPVFFGGDTVFPSWGNQYLWGGEEQLPGFQLRGRGPHGGYTTTSAKCSVCHSAHSAPVTQASTSLSSATSWTNRSLTRLGDTGCEYCHLTGSPVGWAGMSSNIVYHGGTGVSQIEDVESGHSLGLARTIPASTTNPDLATAPERTIDLTCTTCHAVHGSFGAWMTSDFWRGDVTDPVTSTLFEAAGQFSNDETVADMGYKMLRSNPFGAESVMAEAPGDDPIVYAHDIDQVNQYTLSIWCANCHNLTLREQPESRTTMIDGFASLVTTFTVQSTANVHSGGFATAEGADDPLEEAHATILYGVYSGPGQCYTCHRGDLGGPRTATWDPPHGVVPISPEDNPPVQDLTDPLNLARFRALGYFGLDSNSTLTSQTAQQARNLACSACHFGTADFARWIPRSDWPHRSADNDIALLGLELAEDDPQPERKDLVNLVCARCHVSINDTLPNGFLISQHFISHSQIDNSQGISSGLDGLLSPGASTNGSGP
ncbi:MAG: hypothetical protein FWF11_02685 [Coriobacteriia bacterium]|nr:hypothetical protein [Coriobacteriia bacterium]